MNSKCSRKEACQHPQPPAADPCGVGVAGAVENYARPFPYYGGNSRAHNKTCPTIFSAIPPAKSFLSFEPSPNHSSSRGSIPELPTITLQNGKPLIDMSL